MLILILANEHKIIITLLSVLLNYKDCNLYAIVVQRVFARDNKSWKQAESCLPSIHMQVKLKGRDKGWIMSCYFPMMTHSFSCRLQCIKQWSRSPREKEELAPIEWLGHPQRIWNGNGNIPTVSSASSVRWRDSVFLRRIWMPPAL